LIVGSIGVATDGRAMNVFATLGRNRRLYRSWLSFAARMMAFGTLPRAETELMILRVADNRRCEYEWRQHQVLAERVGLGPDAVEAIQTAPLAPSWTPPACAAACSG
jgi:alkylhydroperoxidase family enzyme